VRAYPRSFFLAMLVNLLFFASMHVLIAPWPLYVESVGGLPRDVGLTTGAFALMAVIARPLVGFLVDRWGRREVLLTGLFLFAVVPLTFIALRSVPLLVAARMVHGIGIAAFTTAYTVLMAEMVSAGQRGGALGLAGVAPSLSLMIWPPLGMPILERFGFGPLFLFASLLATLGLIAGFGIQGGNAGGENPGRSQPRTTFRSVLRQRAVLIPTLTTFTLGAAFGSILTFLPLFVSERRLGNAGLYFSAYALAYALARTPLGSLADRWGYRRVGVPCLAGVVLSFGMMTYVPTLALLLAQGVLLGVMMGGIRSVLDVLVVNRASSAARGTAVSVMYAGFDSGIGGGSAILGLWAERVGYGGMYTTVAVISLIGLLVFALLLDGE